MKELVESFLDYLEVEKGASINTRSSYLLDLGQFEAFLKRTLPQKKIDVGKVRAGDIIAFAGSFHALCKKATISRKLSSIKSFFKFLVRKGFVKKDPASVVTLPRREKRLPAVLTVEETDEGGRYHRLCGEFSRALQKGNHFKKTLLDKKFL